MKVTVHVEGRKDEQLTSLISKTGFLLAARGEGKTTTREMVAYECTHRSFRHRALAICYYDFVPILEQVEGDPTCITARIHVQNIVRSLFKTLADEEEVSPTWLL